MNIPSFDPKVEIPLMEDFDTIQGEGFHTGKAAYFVRLAGCDVGCTWCDVKESWTIDSNQIVTLDDLLERINGSKSEIVVITGGEPAMHDLTELTARIKESGKQTHLETSGTHELKGEIDWVTFSPKRFKKPLTDFYSIAHELKVVINHKNDLRWAQEHASKLPPNCHLYLQPEWEQEKELLPTIIDFIKNEPQFKVSLQTHKYMNIP